LSKLTISDAVILLWKQSTTPTPASNLFQEEDEENKETWNVVKSLRSKTFSAKHFQINCTCLRKK